MQILEASIYTHTHRDKGSKETEVKSQFANIRGKKLERCRKPEYGYIKLPEVYVSPHQLESM